eukprot:2762223-Amphidinium_carterae.1
MFQINSNRAARPTNNAISIGEYMENPWRSRQCSNARRRESLSTRLTTRPTFHDFSIITTGLEYNADHAVTMIRYNYSDEQKAKSPTPP